MLPEIQNYITWHAVESMLTVYDYSPPKNRVIYAMLNQCDETVSETGSQSVLLKVSNRLEWEASSHVVTIVHG